MSEVERRCANCGRPGPADEAHRDGWCDRCRGRVVGRATRVAQVMGVVVATGVAAAIFGWLRPGPRFLVGWLSLVAVSYFVAYTLARRVAFEVIRSRGVPPPEE